MSNNPLGVKITNVFPGEEAISFGSRVSGGVGRSTEVVALQQLLGCTAKQMNIGVRAFIFDVPGYLVNPIPFAASYELRNTDCDIIGKFDKSVKLLVSVIHMEYVNNSIVREVFSHAFPVLPNLFHS